MNRAARIGILSLSVAIFCYAGIGHVLGRTPDDRAYKSLSVYGEVLQRIQSDYVDEPNMRLVTAGSLHGLLESLDPQSSYLTPREYTEFKQKQQSSGTGETGLTLSKRFGYVIVISVLPESSAEKAGIHSGDIFESIASFTTRDMSVGQALNLLNGPAGSGVKVGVIRRGKAEPESVDLVREKRPGYSGAPGTVVGRRPRRRTAQQAPGSGETGDSQGDSGFAGVRPGTGQ
jgi:carboxyl-terminal processing protease